MIKNYFKIAYRQLFKNKLFSALNIFGLATSLAVCMLIITVLYDQYSYDNFHEKEDGIFRVISAKVENGMPISQANMATTSLQLAEDLKDNYPFVKQTVRVAGVGGNFTQNEKLVVANKNGYMVDHAFFDVFSFGWTAGDQATALQEPRTIVVTEEFVEDNVLGKDLIGEFLEFEDLGKFKVTGIMPTPPMRSHLRFKFLMSYATVETMTKEDLQKVEIYDFDDIHRGLVYVLLDGKNNRPEFNNALTNIANNYASRDKRNKYLFESQALADIVPSRDLGNEPGLGTPQMVLNFLMILGLIIMLAASFNYMNLSVARSLKRAKEIGIRKVAGARKSDIITQFLGEAVLISFMSFLLAIGLLELLIPAFYALDPFVEEAFYLTKSPQLYLIFLGFSLLVGLFAGIFPAFNISKFQPLQSIQKLSNVKFFSQNRFRKGLVTFQFALSLIFILTVIIVLQQQKKVLDADLGIRIDNKMNVWLNNEVPYEIFAQRIEQIKGVESVSASWNPVMLGGMRSTTAIFNDQSDSIKLSFNKVSQSYLDNMEIELLAGKNFPENINSKGEQFVLLNEKAIRQMGFESPAAALGTSVSMDSVSLTVIGVTKDFYYDNIYFGKLNPFALRLGNKFGVANISLSEANTSATIQSIHQALNEISPQESMTTFFTDQKAYHLSKFFRIGSSIIGFVGFLTILISCLGLLGMVVYAVEGRLKEVGIRKVLGASERNLNWQLAKGFFLLLAIAILIAVPLTFFLSNLWLQNFLIRTDITFWMIAAGVGIILFLAFVTILSQTHLAARKNPVNVLKDE
ncbi:MAG: FtsX-like permease family protein [Saprospiraceae bacterium]